MLRTIAQEYKFNIIRIYSSWVYHNPEPDRFDFEELDEVMGYCDEFGLRVLMGVITEDAPYWLEAAHPEARYVNAKDQAQKLDGSGNNVSGGWPGLCLDWAPVREAAGKFIREMAEVVAAHRSMYAYDCWNEPHIEPAWGHHFSETTDELLFCYCSQTTVAFQTWLERRYGTLDRLNEAWVRRYPSWKVIRPGRQFHGALHLGVLGAQRRRGVRSSSPGFFLLWLFFSLLAKDPKLPYQNLAPGWPRNDDLAVLDGGTSPFASALARNDRPCSSKVTHIGNAT
jgi:hypothetical protein